ncbi:hypothetical protein N431DRAFT_535924 [Stipitochalara longipes BDJ]|nr:hypothetical protein N431DRAFT_535924 [Stipitochalara longipes BDJ]
MNNGCISRKLPGHLSMNGMLHLTLLFKLLTFRLHLMRLEFFFAKCHDTAGFLCGIWVVKAPALLHFSVADSAPLLEDIEPGVTYSISTSNLRAVTARVIEFPLKDSYTGLQSSVFPGPEEQMLAMMRGDKLWEQFEPWTDFEQSWRRFHEYIDEKFYDRKGTLLYYLGEAEEWIVDHLEKPFGLEITDQILYSINFRRPLPSLTFSFLDHGMW